MVAKKNMNLIEAKDITRTYKVGTVEIHALRSVNLNVRQGEYVSVMGHSGSGKSTLMHILGCLDTPTSGKYRLKGMDVTSLSEDRLATIRNREIGFIFQTFNLLSRASVLHNVELPLIYRGLPSKERKRKSISVLEKVGLGDRINHHPNQLSGGERQRVAIARAIVVNPSLILADEPTGNLDSKKREEILTLFDEIYREGNTLIVVTHERYVAKMAERIVHIKDGSIR